MAFKVNRRKSVNVMRIGMKVIGTVIALYASGYMLTVMGTVMNSTCSPFYEGLTLIGWTVSNTYCTTTSAVNANTISATSGSGILSVIGLLAIVWILFEFIEVRF